MQTPLWLVADCAIDNPQAVRKLARRIKERLRDEIQPMLQRPSNETSIEVQRMIELIDHYRHTPEEIARQLEELDIFLSERSEDVYRCTCEDGDTPRGSMDYEVNAYEHHPDCPSGSEYHYHVLLAGLVAHFRKEVTHAHPR